MDRYLTRNVWREQRSNQASAVKVTLRPMSRAEQNDYVRPKETTWASLTLRIAGSRSELPTLRANVSFVGGADGMFAPEPRRREGHAVVWVSLRRDHIDPCGVSPFNGTWQIRWESAKLISLSGSQWEGVKKTPFVFLSASATVRGATSLRCCADTAAFD